MKYMYSTEDYRILAQRYHSNAWQIDTNNSSHIRISTLAHSHTHTSQGANEKNLIRIMKIHWKLFAEPESNVDKLIFPIDGVNFFLGQPICLNREGETVKPTKEEPNIEHNIDEMDRNCD